jgi:dTDP-3-amino-3,4,6-trideoxy-alpha-D-glucose transaminase
MNVQLNDFKRQWDAVGEDVQQAVARVGRSGWYVLGTQVEAFERTLETEWPIRHAIGVGNGLDAIEIGLRCLGVGEGDRVLTTPLSAFATTLAILRVGATPVFVDVDERGLIDPQLCRQALSEQPAIRCLLPVHLYGQPLNADTLRELKHRYELSILEDCAQSVLARWGGLATGRVGHVAATSFYPTKNLGAMGDGGAVLTDSEAIASKARELRNYGQSRQYVHDSVGLNSRLDEMQAAILDNAMLPRLAEWTARRRAIARRYLHEIEHPWIELPRRVEACDPSWHLFPVVVEAGKRASLVEHLRAAEVTTGIHYPTLIPDQKAMKEYARFEVRGTLARAQRFARGEVSLPIHPFLRDDEVAHVINACNAWRDA